ncbi:MAG TPA: rRNA maturation RNase YbeY [Candidatus Paceibacterota bacterium]
MAVGAKIPAHRSTGEGGYTLTKLVKGRMPVLPFLHLKNKVLGKTYALSLVIAGDQYTKKLNRLYRKKTYIPNVLSFPIEKGTGEIVLNMGQAKRECRARGESLRFFVALLFIHSLLHLKGYRHGSTMERREQELLSKFHIKNRF